MAQKRKITDKNLYELLEVLSTGTEQEIRKAYRKKALKCHPDKNPDNPKAAELFHELSEALEILLDVKAREAYDRSLKAKEQAKERLKVLDSKRRKFKEDLERREQAAKEEAIARRAQQSYSTAHLSEEESLQKEVERLRKEGSKALQEEQELIRQQILKEQQGKFSFISPADSISPRGNLEGARIKVKWSKTDSPKSYDSLMKQFSKYGKVSTLVVGKKSAIVEFENQSEADDAFEGEAGQSSDIQLEWLSKCSTASSSESRPTTTDSTNAPTFPAFKLAQVPGNSVNPNPTQPMAATNFADFEAMILGKLSAAAEAQKQNSSSQSESSDSNSKT